MVQLLVLILSNRQPNCHYSLLEHSTRNQREAMLRQSSKRAGIGLLHVHSSHHPRYCLLLQYICNQCRYEERPLQSTPWNRSRLLLLTIHFSQGLWQSELFLPQLPGWNQDIPCHFRAHGWFHSFLPICRDV